MKASDGKKRKIQASDARGLLRIIQSISSPKAEPFKQWLAKVGAERLAEIENPELASKEQGNYMFQKAIQMTGLKNECGVLRLEKN